MKIFHIQYTRVDTSRDVCSLVVGSEDDLISIFKDTEVEVKSLYIRTEEGKFEDSKDETKI